MRLIALVAIVLACIGVAHSRPVIIEESAILTPPPGSNYARFGNMAGTNGEWALVTGQHPSTGSYGDITTFDALLYRRVNGSWVYQRVLAQGARDLGEDWSYFPVVIGMKGNLASAILGETYSTIFRFNGTDWVPAGNGANLQEDVSIDGERILYGVGEAWNGRVYEPNGANGWTATGLTGQPRCCDDEFWGGPVDLLGDRAILGTPDTWDLEAQEIPIYQRYSTGWALLTKLQVPADTWRLGAEVGLHANNAIVNSLGGFAYVWGNGNFYGEPSGRVQPVNAYARGATMYQFAKEGELLLASAFDPDFNRVVINVFQRDSSNRYERVAILKPKGTAGISTIEIDGNTVIAGSNPQAFIFNLPASFAAPQPRYENFESGNGANWTPSAGAQFTVVRPTSVNGVYRQASLAGDAHSVLGNTSWANQGVEADIRPTAFNCADCWVGLATRYLNAQNYYYVTLRGGQTVQLKRMRNGVFTTLASAALPVQLNRNYRVRLDSIGSTHRVHVDGKLVLTFEDTVPVVAGNAALVMYKAQADYDNVAASPTPRSTIFAHDFSDPSDTYRGNWTHTGTGQWNQVNGVYAQTSVAGDSRALIGTPTDDQVVSLRVRPTSYAATSTGQERWVGVIARYTNDQNYYYLTLRSGGTLSLRKLVNGAITTIASVPASVALGSWYSLKLEATGSALRAYLNGNLVIQATDTSHASGRAGPVSYKAAAEFDDYVAYQP
jgi:hypothetical protein